MKNILKFITKWSELITIPIAIMLWYFSDTFLRWLDPTSATYDAGIFQIILFSIIQFFILSGIVWIYIKITFPNVYKYLDDVLGNNLKENDIQKNNLTQWEKSKIVLWLFSLFLIVITLLARVL
jgi:hypothetical protein